MFLERFETFRDSCQPNLYDFFWPFRPQHLVSCCGWGPAVLPKIGGASSFSLAADEREGPEGLTNKETTECLRQEIYFGTRADESSVYNRNQN